MGTAELLTTPGAAPAGRNRDWLLASLPALPLGLLVVRMWYLGHQDMPTTLLLIQHVNPLSAVSALVITLLWALPVVVLAIRTLGGLLTVSTPDAGRSRLSYAGGRIPDWAVALAVLLAALTWQLRFLPLLAMAVLAIVGLTARQRSEGRTLLLVTGVVLPATAAVAAYAVLAPAIAAAVTAGEQLTATLLAAPPALAVLLTGPVPARFAFAVTHWPALVAGLLAPFLVGAIFVRIPVLSPVALEVSAGPEAAPTVVRGHAVTVDDRMTVLLVGDGVRFVRNDDIVSKTLCPDPEQVPASVVTVHGWHVEQAALEWLAAVRRPAPIDPRCLGRPTS